MILVLAEKREQGEKIAHGLDLQSATNCFQGMYGSENMVLVWASGHLVELQEPQDAKPDIDWRNPDLLLPLPKRPQIRIKPNQKTKTQVNFIREKVHLAREIWIATDPDREGEAIGRELLQHVGCQAKLKRMWLSESLEPADIRKAANHLKEGRETVALWRAQQARNQSDWFYQFLTRAYTISGRLGLMGANLKKGDKKSSVVSVGRVQTAALKMVVDRDAAIENFVSTTHYLPELYFIYRDTPFKTSYKPVMPEGEKAPYFTNKTQVVEFIHRVLARKKGQLVHYGAKPKHKNPPTPFSLTDLQRYMSRLYDMDPSKTLKITNDLRLKGYLTYPRTEHGELPRSFFCQDGVGNVIKASAAAGPFRAQAEMALSHLEFGENPKWVPSCFVSKPMEHHGIIPTTTIPGKDELNKDQRTLYDACVKQFLQALYPAATFEERNVEVVVDCEGLLNDTPARFVATSSTLVEPGWMAAFGDLPEPVDPLPEIVNKPSLPLQKVDLVEKHTHPPKPFTDDTFLGALANAGRQVEDEESRKILNAVAGIGTPATRHTIIETLFVRNYLVKKKKCIHATVRGIDLIDQVPELLSSVEMTAKWEQVLKDIAALNDDVQAKELKDRFIDSHAKMLTEIINDICNQVAERNVAANSIEELSVVVVKVAKMRGIEHPPLALVDPVVARRWLDSIKTLPPPPTPKMRALAEKLAAERRVDISEKLSSFDDTKKFIDGILGQTKARKKDGRPTAKMLTTAENIAARKKLTLPRSLKSDFKICKQFLDEHIGGQQR